MRSRRRAIVGGLWLLVAALPTPTTGAAELSELLRALDLAGYPQGEKPPEFSVRTSDGSRLSLAALRGRVVLLTFWATWCIPCREEMPVFDRLHRRLAGGGLGVVGVNVREEEAAIAQYRRMLGLTFPLVLDPVGSVQVSYGVIALPTTFLIARDGRAVARAVGPRDWSTAQSLALIRALLADPPTRSNRSR